MCPGQGSSILSMEKGVSKGKDCVREFREGDTIHPGVGLPCHPDTNGTSILLQWKSKECVAGFRVKSIKCHPPILNGG